MLQNKFLTAWVFVIFIFIVAGIAAVSSFTFLTSLQFVSTYRVTHPEIIYLLPFAGLTLIFMSKQLGKNQNLSFSEVRKEILTPKKTLPLKMSLYIFTGSLLTHLFGGSAGREGVAVQMSASLSDFIFSVFPHSQNQLKKLRQIILIMSLSAGFSAIFGTPLAGAVFGLEVFKIGTLRWKALIPCVAVSFLAHYLCIQLGAQHSIFNKPDPFNFTLSSLFYILLASLLFGYCAKTFVFFKNKTQEILNAKLKNPYLKIFFGGALILSMSYSTTRYLGLGVPIIEQSLITPTLYFDFLLKAVFTIITLSSGYLGGEVTPLFFIGSTLGNFLSTLIPLPLSFLASLGFVSVFAAAANTPLTGLFLALEIFGPSHFFYFLIACFLSSYIAGPNGIYNYKTKDSNEIRN